VGAYLGRVEGVIVYRVDAVVTRVGGYPPRDPPPRGTITEFSRKSRQRLAFVASNTAVTFKTMITLTYPSEFPCDGATVKGHFRAFLQFLRRDCGSPSYLWFLEFQQRGAPHMHILIDWPWPRSRIVAQAFRFRVSSSWYRIVGSGDTKHLAAGCRSERIRKLDGARHYAVKYALKMRQKEVPQAYQNVGRFWGCSKDVVPIAEGTVQCTEDDIRGALDDWRYKQPDDQALWSVLYNCADRFRDRLTDAQI
jgi:hypothetical protein